MNRIESFNQILAAGELQFSILTFSINLILTALLAYLLGLLYNRYGNSISNRRGFSQNFVLLAIATMIVITIVKSSLALSLGLVGALSIVRFRAAIKEPEELTYLFLNIAIGLGLGADQKIATIVGFVFVSLYVIGKHYLSSKTNIDNQNLILNVTVADPGADSMAKIIELIEKHTIKANLKRFDENISSLDMSFIIEVNSFSDISQAKTGLQKQFANITVSLLDNNIIV